MLKESEKNLGEDDSLYQGRDLKMIHLTEDQYAMAFLAASNLRTSVHEKDPYSYLPYEQQLIGYTTMLTGSCPSEEVTEKAVALAKKMTEQMVSNQ